jgi:aspartyl protease family protein
MYRKKLERNDLMSNLENHNESNNRLGKGMITTAWIIALIFLTLFFNRWLNERNNPNQNPVSSRENGINQVILQRNFQHHYVATGTINGVSVTFLVDTGATTVSVPAHLATKLQLKPGAPQITNTANGIVETRGTTIDELTLGTIVLRDVRASLNPGMKIDEVLLGMSALKNIEFTHRDGILTLKQY